MNIERYENEVYHLKFHHMWFTVQELVKYDKKELRTNINEFRNNSYKREVRSEFEERCKAGATDVSVNI